MILFFLFVFASNVQSSYRFSRSDSLLKTLTTKIKLNEPPFYSWHSCAKKCFRRFIKLIKKPYKLLHVHGVLSSCTRSEGLSSNHSHLTATSVIPDGSACQDALKDGSAGGALRYVDSSSLCPTEEKISGLSQIFAILVKLILIIFTKKIFFFTVESHKSSQEQFNLFCIALNGAKHFLGKWVNVICICDWQGRLHKHRDTFFTVRALISEF